MSSIAGKHCNHLNSTYRTIVVVIKNSGHDFKGRSAGKDGFALWIHHLNETRRNQQFVPKGCHIPPQDSLTVAGGVQWETAYKRADELNITIVGGAVGQIGSSGGWLMVRKSFFLDREAFLICSLLAQGWRSLRTHSDMGSRCG